MTLLFRSLALTLLVSGFIAGCGKGSSAPLQAAVPPPATAPQTEEARKVDAFLSEFEKVPKEELATFMQLHQEELKLMGGPGVDPQAQERFKQIMATKG